MKLIEAIAKNHKELTEWRQDIHAHPELGFEEERTAKLVAERLVRPGAAAMYRPHGRWNVLVSAAALPRNSGRSHSSTTCLASIFITS